MSIFVSLFVKSNNDDYNVEKNTTEQESTVNEWTEHHNYYFNENREKVTKYGDYQLPPVTLFS